MFFFGGVFVFPNVFRKQTNHSRKPTIQKKTKENKTNLLENQKTKFLKVSDTPLDIFWVSPKVFRKQNNIRKTKNTKEHQIKPKNLVENQAHKFLKVSDPPLDMGLVLFVFLFFPNVFQKTKQILKTTNNTKENQRTQKQTLGKTTKTKLLNISYPHLDMGLFFLLFVGFPEGFQITKKTFEKTKPTKENQRKPTKTLGKTKKQQSC